MKTKTKEFEEDDVAVAEREEELHNLIIWNDDITTFAEVEDALMEICKHSKLQAIQCSLIIHNNGKCSVKRGTYKKLRPMCEAILDRKITATIE